MTERPGRQSPGKGEARAYALVVTDSFVRDLETLEVSRELLLSGSIAKARMALILLDSLIDALLYRRLVLMYAAEEENWIMDPPRFPKSVRTTARKNFDERLRIVQQPSWLPWIGSSEPLVMELEAVVLSVGHSYRNAAYHRDTHNPKVVAPLTKVFYGAVATAFSRSHAHGLVIGVGGGLSGELPDPLVRLGIENPGGLGLTHRDAAVAARRSSWRGWTCLWRSSENISQTT
jgi:hypothetical protein